MTTYTEPDYREIAAAVGMETDRVIKHRHELEAAALWYRLDRKHVSQRTPSARRGKLEQIRKTALRLLNHLGIHDLAAAVDGPADQELLWILTYPEGSDEDVVLRATAQVGRLVELLDAIEAAATIASLAERAIGDVTELGRLAVTKGHIGDDAVNGWIAAMMEIYRAITGNEPKSSIGAPGQPDEGMARGPLIRFLAAAGRPLGIKYQTDAWRSRVRTILKYSQN